MTTTVSDFHSEGKVKFFSNEQCLVIHVVRLSMTNVFRTRDVSIIFTDFSLISWSHEFACSRLF